MITEPSSRSEKTMIMLRTSTTVRTARLAIFTALSVVGSLIQIPSPVGSLAFDSAPGFFAALFFGPVEGALVCGMGHLATAAVSGFPLGVLHIPIALGMSLAGAAIGLISRLNKRWGFVPALVTGVIINTILVFPLVPWLAADVNAGLVVALAYAPFLVVAATLNAVVTAIVFAATRGKLKT